MKRILLFFLLVFAQGFSQNITIQQLVDLRTKPFEEIHKHFTAANWKLMDERFVVRHNIGSAVLLSPDEANPITLEVLYDAAVASNTKLKLSLRDKTQFDKFKAEIESLFKFTSTKTDSGKTETVFGNDSVILQVISHRKSFDAPAKFEIHITDTNYKNRLYNFGQGK